MTWTLLYAQTTLIDTHRSISGLVHGSYDVNQYLGNITYKINWNVPKILENLTQQFIYLSITF